MSDSRNVLSESQKRRKLSSEKIKELNSYLSKQKPPGASSGGQKDRGDDLNHSQIASELFAKAPVEFLERKTMKDLAEITDKAARAVESCTARASEIQITPELHEDRTSFFVALRDRPFVVNTITECVRYFGGNISVLLHPIIVRDGHRISLSYVETEKISPAQLTLLERRLGNSLKDLTLVTDDFTSMLVRTETLARVLDNSSYRSNTPLTERREVSEFLRWLTDGNFIFIGHAEWRFDESETLLKKPNSTLGILKTSQSFKTALIAESHEDALGMLDRNELLTVTKLRIESPVHRRLRMLNIVVQELSTEGRVNAVHSLIGMLTSKALSQESSSVPVIRRKLQKVIEVEDVIHNSHDYKYIVDIVDSMPKEEALRTDTEALRDVIHTILDIQNKNETRLSLRHDASRRGVSILIVMPRDRFNTQVRNKIQQYVESAFKASPGSSEYHLDLSNKPLARFYFYIPLPEGEIPQVDLARFQSDISNLSMTWSDLMRERFTSSAHFADSQGVSAKFAQAFPDDYQALQTVEDCEQDVKVIESLDRNHPVRVSMSDLPNKPGFMGLIVYSLGSELTLSQALPYLENSGFEVFTERSSKVQPLGTDPVYLYRFLVRPRSGSSVAPEAFSQVLSPGLSELFAGKAENDVLNSLMLTAGLNMRAISLLRVYCCSLWQVNTFATKRAIFETLASVPPAALQLWKMFELRFDPALKHSVADRNKKLAEMLNKYRDGLREVTDITRDRVLRALGSLLEHTLRTNFYNNTPAIAIKLHSEKIDVMPSPRPLYEIFVRSTSMEGVHLRSSKVARGGIRWSERNDDYRREILGLMKTQKTKNVVIVPEGAKGGFIVRELPKEPEKRMETVTEAYREFIRACLSLADNRIGNDIKSPDKLVIYDDLDPYFVVAADKGTASFSDVANKIAVEEFDFWLSDAFASGGSKGYDHKVYGITAKGAWECVQRHFRELGFDHEKTPFTVVGIGDMSGDVFGNGLLLSKNMKLIGAFDHRHIFIDPSPEIEQAYKERQRLFEKPRSQWTDYNPALISKGGKVYGRFDKEIELSPEAREALSIPKDVPSVLNGDQVINWIMRARVDLLWNGGIGTYVKSSEESHSEVNDGTNDAVRVNADELGARVVGEGGNLGFTQKARIEFARNGGHINTDAIDNSGGVDLSDHEVNLKILFSGLLRQKKVTLAERDKLMKEMAGEVVEEVLSHNRSHALVLTIGVQRSRKNIEYFQSLIRNLVKMNFVNRELECLPDDDELAERISKKQGMTSPELAICLAGVKMLTKSVMLKSELNKDTLLKPYLLSYFPEVLQKRFKDEILAHPLAGNIIATQVTNSLIDSIGITFIHRMCISHSVLPSTVIKCALAAHFLLDSQNLRESVKKFDTVADRENFLKLWIETSNAIREVTSWLISHHGASMPLDKIVELYQSSYRTLVDNADRIFAGAEKEAYDKRLAKYKAMQLPEFCCRSLAGFPRIVAILEMLSSSRSSNKDVTLVAQVFAQVLDKLGIGYVLKLETAVETNNKWESELLVNSFEEIRRSVSGITAKLLDKGITGDKQIADAIRNSGSYEQLSNTIEEIKEGTPNAAALSVVAKQLRVFELG